MTVSCAGNLLHRPCASCLAIIDEDEHMKHVAMAAYLRATRVGLPLSTVIAAWDDRSRRSPPPPGRAPARGGNAKTPTRGAHANFTTPTPLRSRGGISVSR